jgi:leucyl aminopeptidase
MKITIEKGMDKKQEILVYGYTTKTQLKDKPLQKEVTAAINQKIFVIDKFGKQYSTTIKGQKVLVIALGDEKELTPDHLRRALGKAVKYTKCSRRKSFSTNLLDLFSLGAVEVGRCSGEGLVLSNYKFIKYFGEEKKEEHQPVEHVVLQWSGDLEKLTQGLKEGVTIAECTNYAKDLVNEPPTNLSPSDLEKEAKKLDKGKVSVKVLDVDDMKKLGMGAIIGVGMGSERPPKMIFLDYNGDGSSKYTAIVGKGITFDSGGYNIKPTKYIEDMKTDMAGSAAVLATIKCLSTLGVKKNVIGVMACADNLVSGSAQLPGDIVKAYNGKTIEIGNTDAEGRLVLADALSYTEDKYKPEFMVDLATLTGACVVALGYETAAIMGKDENLIKELFDAGNRSYDRVWQLPFFEEYQNKMDGAISDLNNISQKGKGFEGGSITAGVFLSKFVDKTTWAHIDIAGTAYVVEEGDYHQKDATGAGVRLLSYWLAGF